MKRLFLLCAMALTLSGCVSDGPGPRGYDPYWDGYERERVVVYRDRDRLRPIYRNERPIYRDPYDDRDAAREGRWDRRRYEARRSMDHRAMERQPVERRSERRAEAPEPRRPAPSAQRARQPERTVRPDRPAAAPTAAAPWPAAGPRPYIPPVRPTE